MTSVVAAAVYSHGKKITDINLNEGKEWACKPEHFVWIGLHDPGSEELLNLQKQFNLHALAIEDALLQHTRPKLETFGDALFMVLYSPVMENDKLVFVETQLFAGKGYVISCRYGDSPPTLRSAAADARARRRFCAVRTAQLCDRKLPTAAGSV